MAEPIQHADSNRERLEAAEVCAKLLRDHLTGDGGFGGKPALLACAGCRDAVQAWERQKVMAEVEANDRRLFEALDRTAHNDGDDGG